ncbi:amidohydrolase/deacetylase family metallohydrolase [Cohnella silvisoli]|uniref:Amidohydrolase/deacetylase family metallohydrolase n=1 Tax=Cohnella silvisoli TaxID=2873699 RepID=A0ABV1L0B5_9BACL|nr:amidohydrolase/deacetylase family metallohydrolase [Cohnella silvisoli]MCD9025143.1 amidohydrolase/deacetylase family metallohydrolase [Cohnella silvisoli]
MESLLLKNVQPVGFSSGLQKGMDMRINKDGIVEEVGFGLRAAEADRQLDLAKFHLSPGWIDMHAHVYHQASSISVDPDRIGPCSGVTAIVDTGSAGFANFDGFRDYVISPRNYPILSFLNIGATGLIYANEVSELDSLEKINLDRLVSCVDENRQFIKGLKIRASGVILRGLGIEMVKLAKRTAAELDLPLMVHVGEPLPMLEDILALMEPGDIITHCYHGKRWGIFKRGELISEFIRAFDRGVRFDVGHGSASFNYEVAERAIALGYKPFSIGSDLHVGNIDGPVWDLPTTMSKLLSLGLSVEEVICCVTTNPASVVDLERFQNELVGTRARFTIFSLDPAVARVMDSGGNERMIDCIFRPAYTIIGNEVIHAKLRIPL